MAKIYLKDKPKNILDLLSKFFIFYGGSWTTSRDTYYDKECKKIQCRTGSIRSFNDLYDCCLTYFPRTKPETLFKKILLSYFLLNGLKRKTFLYRCLTIKRQTLYYTSNTQGYNQIVLLEKLNSKYSYKDLLDKLKIYSQKDLDKFLKNNKQYEIK